MNEDIENKYDNIEKWSVTFKNMSVICAILVIFIHVYNLEIYQIHSGIVYNIETIISQNISRIAVPWFFISSAFLLYRKNYPISYVYSSRFKAVVVPYLIWNTIYTFAFFLLNKIGLINSGFSDISFENVLLGVFLYKWNYTFWFINQLIILVILYPLIRCIITRNKFLSIVLLCVCVAIYTICGEFITYNGINLFRLSSLGYYLIGAVLGDMYKNMKKENRRILKKEYCVACVIMYLGTKICCSYYPSINTDFIQNIFLLYLTYYLVDIKNFRLEGWLTKITFLLYALHPIILESIEKIFLYFLPKTNIGAIIDYFLAPIITIIIIYFITLIWSKLLPKTYKICSGGR